MTSTEERVLERGAEEPEPPEGAHESIEEVAEAPEEPDCTCEGGIVRL